MQVQIVSAIGKRKPAEALILPYWEDKKKPVPAFAKADIDEALLSLLEGDFKADISEINYSYSLEGVEKKIILLGLGKKSTSSSATLRKAFAALTVFCRKKKIDTLNVLLPDAIEDDKLEAIVDAFCMANYSFDESKRETLKERPTLLLKKVNLIGGKKKQQEIVDRHLLLMESVNLTRALVNRNADETKAKDLVLIAKELADKYSSIRCEVLGKKELEKEKMGLLLAVNRGSSHDAALIVLTYKGDPKNSDTTAVVGKGITFDTGGLNLKPTGGIESMRIDMAGAAAVLGVLQAAASLKIKKNIIGVIATAENAISAEAYKPGDVYISHSGKSVEISNTDAEGRLVLADAFSYVQKHHSPSRIIDLATLTGGIVVAIGEEASGLFCNEPKMTKQIKQAADHTGERVWEMPLYPEYAKALKSTIADLKNSSTGRKASPCMGAIFLQQFIEKDMPWAHLDIAGTAYLSEANSYYPDFATGVGVKLLLSFVENL
ncbi:MAG: leucyl aminopeptidase [Chlamydiota bacterium]